MPAVASPRGSTVRQVAHAQPAWQLPSRKLRLPRGQIVRRNQGSRGQRQRAQHSRVPTKPRYAYQGRSPRGLPICFRDRISRRQKSDRRAPQRKTRIRSDAPRRRKNDNFHRVPTAKGQSAQSNHAVFGHGGFSAMCLHEPTVDKLWTNGNAYPSGGCSAHPLHRAFR